VLTNFIFSQEKPVWDIGTKWTYEFNWMWVPNDTFDSAVIEIVDTVTIDGLKLFLATRTHSTCNTSFYLHYKGQKVYNYNVNSQLLQLLYDFDSDASYETEYFPKCGLDVNQNMGLADIPIVIDSIKQYQMSDGSMRKLKYVRARDIYRSDTSLVMNHYHEVLDGIGFMRGSGFYTHEWFLDEYYCDQVTCFVKYLRCFENDTIKYNFVSFPCDSSFTSSQNVLEDIDLKIYPNPTTEFIKVNSTTPNFDYELFTLEGKLIEKDNITKTHKIQLPKSGVFILRIREGERWIAKKVVRIN